MRCIHCGFPLSPTGTQAHCPRCNAPLVTSAKPTGVLSQRQRGNQAWEGHEQVGTGNPSWASGQPSHHSYGETALQTQSSPPSPASSRWAIGSYQNQLPSSALEQAAFLQAGQMWQPTLTPPQSPIPTPVEMVMRNNTAPQLLSRRAAGTLYPVPTPTIRSQIWRAGNLGFLIAGLCVLTGGLLLVFVYMMALNLPSTNASSAYVGSVETPGTIVSPHAPATPVPSPEPSPTVSAFPGQQFIDNPQMASTVDINTAQPLQTATTFKVNQRIYVTFNIHPDGKSGAVCLYWYLNHANVTQFPFAVTESAHAGYSYAVYGSAGPGYVEIYWASSTACSDKLLAQHVNFTVTA